MLFATVKMELGTSDREVVMNRVIVEWLLISHCDVLAVQSRTGYVKSGLFLMKPNATIENTDSWQKE